jgi:membrane protease YdiL (CAAX protease family)
MATILACYLLSASIVGTQVGPWEAVRHSVVGGFLAFAWLLAVHHTLRDAPIPELPPVKQPRIELAILLAALLGMVSLAAIRYGGQYNLPSWPYYLLSYGAVLAIFVAGGYGARGLGLTLPPRRAWLGIAAVIGLNMIAAIIFQILPAGEAADLPAADLAQQLSTPFSVLVLFLGLLFRAALPEELVLRVGIQPRLANLMPAGWAIVVQALLFSAGHLPRQFISYDRPLLLAIGYLLPIENGLLAGYLWYRTKSLPPLLLAHLFAFPRFGI